MAAEEPVAMDVERAAEPAVEPAAEAAAEPQREQPQEPVAMDVERAAEPAVEPAAEAAAEPHREQPQEASPAPEAAEGAAPEAEAAPESAAAAPAEEATVPAEAVADEVAPTEASQPGKPKRNTSAYWLYSTSAREVVSNELKEKNDGKAKLGDVAKEISVRWVAMSAEEKKPFEEKAAADKERYETEMRAFQTALDPVSALRVKYGHMIPKRALSAYFIFCQDANQKEKAVETLKGESKDVTSAQVTKKLGELWKLIGHEEKNGYQQLHSQQHLAFLEKQKVWQATPECAEIAQAEKEHAQKKKVDDAAMAAKEAEEKAQVEKDKRMARKRSKGPVDTPEKTAAPAKKLRTAKATGPAPGPEIDAKVLVEAATAGMEAGLRNLAARPEVLASGKTSRAILDALKSSGGLVNPAKRALLGH